MALLVPSKLNVEQKLLRTLEECKQISRDDRLVLRKIVIEGNCELINILEDSRNKKIQIKLRKFIQKQKENKKSLLVQKTENDDHRRPMSRDDKWNKIQNMMQNLKEFKQKIGGKGSRTQAPSLKNSRTFESQALHTQISNLKTQKYLHDHYAPTEHADIFTPSSFLQQIKQFPYTASKKIFLDAQSTENVCKHEFIEKVPVRGSVKQSKIQILKNILIIYFGENIFEHICQKYFPLNTQNSSYLSYRKLLDQIKKYNQLKSSKLPQDSAQSSILRSFSQFGLLSTSHIPKQNQLQSSITHSKDFINQHESQIPLLAPFQSEFETVTIDKLGSFLEKYCLKKSNEINNMFIIMGISSKDKYLSNCSSITLDRFNQINMWKGKQIIESFKIIVDKWGVNGSISYWQMFRAKEEKQVEQFFEKYRRV